MFSGNFDGGWRTKTFTMSGRRFSMRLAPLTTQPQFSPDGRRLLFTKPGSAVSTENGFIWNRFPSLVTVDAKGQRRRRLSIRGGDGTWAPDGRHIAYVKPSGRLGVEIETTDNDGIWRAWLDGSHRNV